MANTSEHITIRVPSDLAQRIRARAEDEGRSLSGMVVRLVTYAMTGTAPNDRPVKPPTGLMDDVRNHLATSNMGAAVPVQSGRAARVPSDGAALSRAKQAVPAKLERTVEYEE